MNNFKMPEAEQELVPMKPIDFTQLGQKKVRDIHLGVKGPISVTHTRRKQVNNDKAIRKEKAAHLLDKYMDRGEGLDINLSIEERLKIAYERGFQKRAAEVLSK